MACPKCESKNVQIVSDHKTQGYGAGSGCCGLILFGPIGLLLGLCGMGKGKTTHKRICVNCGHKH